MKNDKFWGTKFWISKYEQKPHMDLNSGSAVHKLDHWAMMIFNQIVDTKLQTILQSIKLIKSAFCDVVS